MPIFFVYSVFGTEARTNIQATQVSWWHKTTFYKTIPTYVYVYKSLTTTVGVEGIGLCGTIKCRHQQQLWAGGHLIEDY